MKKRPHRTTVRPATMAKLNRLAALCGEQGLSVPAMWDAMADLMPPNAHAVDRQAVAAGFAELIGEKRRCDDCERVMVSIALDEGDA